MHRFFVEPDQIDDEYAFITGSDVNHIKNVLRMKPGDELRISDGEAHGYYCTVDELGTDSVRVRICYEEKDPTELPAHIVLFQGLPKSDKMETVIQKNTELGVAEIVPMATEFAVMKLDAKKAEGKVTRWNAIAESAAKQSKRLVIPVVRMPMSFKEAVREAADYDLFLFPYEKADGMRAAVEAMKEVLPGKKIAIFIGPEGGFSKKEAELAQEAGARVISLGSRILRTETAGMTAMAWLMYKLETDRLEHEYTKE